MSITDAFKTLEDSLAAAKEHLPALEDIAAHHSAAEAGLRATIEQRDAGLAELKDVQAKVADAKKDLGDKLESFRTQQDRILRDHQQKLDAVKAEITNAEKELASKRQAHDQVLASMQALRQRLG